MYILFIGDTNVGKTTIIDKIKEICHNSETVMNKQITLGIKTHQVKFKGKTLRLIDSGEYYSHKTMIEGFLPYVSTIVVVYDIYSKESFKYAVRLFWEFMVKHNGPKVYDTYLLGNKCDTAGTAGKVGEWKNGHTLKVSGKTGENVKEILEYFISESPKKNTENIEEEPRNLEWCCFF